MSSPNEPKRRKGLTGAMRSTAGSSFKFKVEEPDDPIEYVARVREELEKIVDLFGKKENFDYDIAQQVREIRALLKVNAEIFCRIMESANLGSYSEGKSASFTRYGFDVVKVRQVEGIVPLHGGGPTTQTQFITEYERSTETFDVKLLSEVPAGLNNIIVVKYRAAEYSMFIDYEAFFKSAIALHDDILGPFLAKLKCHMESIQLCLGEVETWLIEPDTNIEFLNATFEKKLEAPSADDFNKQYACPLGTHLNSDLCLYCNRKYSEHIIRTNFTQNFGFDFGQSEFRPGGLNINTICCPVPAVQSAQQIGHAVQPVLQFGHVTKQFKCKKIHVLKVSYESGKFEKTFSIEKQSDRSKLKIFLQFVSS